MPSDRLPPGDQQWISGHGQEHTTNADTGYYNAAFVKSIDVVPSSGAFAVMLSFASGSTHIYEGFDTAEDAQERVTAIIDATGIVVSL